MDDFVVIPLTIILGSIVVLIINYLIAKEFYNVAQSKGYYNQKYLWIPFLIGLAGWLLIVALPTKEYTDEEELKQKPKPKTEQETKQEVENINEIIKYVNGLYIKNISNTNSKTTDSSIEINGINYSSSDWVADGKIQWFWVDDKISYGIKESTKNAPYELKFELVETGINITGFPDVSYNGLYIKK